MVIEELQCLPEFSPTFTSIILRQPGSMLLQSEIERGSNSRLPRHWSSCTELRKFQASAFIFQADPSPLPRLRQHTAMHWLKHTNSSSSSNDIQLPQKVLWLLSCPILISRMTRMTSLVSEPEPNSWGCKGSPLTLWSHSLCKWQLWHNPQSVHAWTAETFLLLSTHQTRALVLKYYRQK